MKVVISMIMSAFGAVFGSIDFFTTYTIVSASITLYQEYFNHANDKTTKQKTYEETDY